MGDVDINDAVGDGWEDDGEDWGSLEVDVRRNFPDIRL